MNWSPKIPGRDKTNLYYWVWNQVADAQVFLQEKTDFGGGDIILDNLANDPNVVLILAEGRECFVDISPGPLNDKRAVRAKDNVEISWRPEARLAYQ